MRKPRIYRPKNIGLWACVNLDALAWGETPFKAYERWKNMIELAKSGNIRAWRCGNA